VLEYECFVLDISEDVSDKVSHFHYNDIEMIKNHKEKTFKIFHVQMQPWKPEKEL